LSEVPELTFTQRRLLAVAAGLALLAGGCGQPRARTPAQVPAAAAPPATAPRPARPADSQVALGDAPAYAALARTDVSVWARPGTTAGSPLALFPAWTGPGQATPFLVQQARRDASGATWYQVLLPHRPNGWTGWVRGDQVSLRPLDDRVVVDLGARRLTLLHRGQVAGHWPVGVGKPGTPTPTGEFFITVKLHPPQISRVYGAWALGLSGYSNVLDQFGTGDGQIALHGTANPDNLGRAVSHGCVRVDNQVITSLARRLPLGTPVEVRG
jgi:lipoprotein-anchoring transpeptidase ErfK/SrfK